MNPAAETGRRRPQAICHHPLAHMLAQAHLSYTQRRLHPRARSPDDTPRTPQQCRQAPCIVRAARLWARVGPNAPHRRCRPRLYWSPPTNGTGADKFACTAGRLEPGRAQHDPAALPRRFPVRGIMAIVVQVCRSALQFEPFHEVIHPWPA